MLHRAIRAVLAAASDAALGVDAALRGDYASACHRLATTGPCGHASKSSSKAGLPSHTRCRP